MRRICKRCHRVRPVNGTGYCPACADTLDGRGKRRRRPQPKEEEPADEPAAEEELAETPRSESLASEPPASGVKA
jgi:hypothetical protein